MAIVKKTKSGKAVQFIDEEGNVFQTSVIAIRNMLEGNFPIVLLNRLPFKVSKDRFKESPLYAPEGYVPPKDETTITNDALSANGRKENEQKKVYTDKEVDW